VSRRAFEDTKRCWLEAAGIQHLSPPGSGESLLPCRSHPLVCPSAATEIPPCCAPMVGAVSALFLLDIKGRVLVWHDFRGNVIVIQDKRFFTKLKEVLSTHQRLYLCCSTTKYEILVPLFDRVHQLATKWHPFEPNLYIS
jgi:hypothetical protein